MWQIVYYIILGLAGLWFALGAVQLVFYIAPLSMGSKTWAQYFRNVGITIVILGLIFAYSYFMGTIEESP